MEWVKLPAPETEWRIDDCGNYLIHKLVSPAGETLGYALLRLKRVGIYETLEQATAEVRKHPDQRAG